MTSCFWQSIRSRESVKSWFLTSSHTAELRACLASRRLVPLNETEGTPSQRREDEADISLDGDLFTHPSRASSAWAFSWSCSLTIEVEGGFRAPPFPVTVGHIAHPLVV